MRAREVMNQFVPHVGVDQNVKDVARLMRDEGAGCVCVCDEQGVPVGVITDRDIVVRACVGETALGELNAGSIMTERPVVCGLDTDLEQVQQTMHVHNIFRVIVVDERGVLRGAVSLAEIWHHQNALAASALSRKLAGRHLRLARPGGHFVIGRHSFPVRP
ncbi:MAG TPA: CBS domain-containing protein [Polyangiaceae bacterium]|nr:CBS domain-containing protein [Polyangiaceae bacterium]